ALGRLTFRAPDENRWPALRLAREVMAAGGAAGAVFNAAKEQALDDFIAGRIRFTDMAPRVEATLTGLAGEAGFGCDPGDLDAVHHWDTLARARTAA
ncbi:MAG: 1-deoxy-D-xylulose-5-phosphate reductoisomerase, partial [Paracoccus sp. (in: a-proteobacteria)]